jgi:putative ABC transport system substrate-binding protein
MKKIIAILMAALICLSMTAMAATYSIGVCQLVQHEALDAATQGFVDALEAKLGEEVSINVQNASGDSATCITIVNGFLANNVNLIMANATPALQAAVAATGDIPILGTSVTEYGTALDIDDFSGVTGFNVSGTSDLAPLDGQAAMVKELFPDAKEIGLISCSAEANSAYQVKEMMKFLTELGYNCTSYVFNDSNDVAAVTESAAAASDVIYIPTDNTAASCTEAIRNVLEPAGIPAIVGEEGLCKGCGVATLSIDYYDLGYATGLMAAKILKGEADISKMAVEYTPAEKITPMYNKAICEELGITPLEGYQPLG